VAVAAELLGAPLERRIKAMLAVTTLEARGAVVEVRLVSAELQQPEALLFLLTLQAPL
jgi:hypothetical protein